MTDALIAALIYFLVALIVSSIIIWVITKLFGEIEGIGTAVMAALTGAVIYTLVSFFLGPGLIPAVIAGVVWILALGSLYDMDWLKTIFTALVVWIIAYVVGIFLPTLGGPL
ncbi:MAG: hypothetical protein KGY76_02775 [Candidatus Thermoplasmatota archaeon]|nr:hypothetical protein [Candidatus Thermoplasmatota archaeon]